MSQPVGVRGTRSIWVTNSTPGIFKNASSDFTCFVKRSPAARRFAESSLARAMAFCFSCSYSAARRSFSSSENSILCSSSWQSAKYCSICSSLSPYFRPSRYRRSSRSSISSRAAGSKSTDRL